MAASFNFYYVYKPMIYLFIYFWREKKIVQPIRKQNFYKVNDSVFTEAQIFSIY